MSDFTPQAALEILLSAARDAGSLALRWFRAGQTTSARIDYKSGGSPVTEADLAADAFLLERLRPLFPDAGWLSEETADSPERLGRRTLIVVDPIDGTRAYAAGDPRWAVSLALVVDGRPVAGVIEAPALGETFAATLNGGATRNGKTIRASARTMIAGGRMAGPPQQGARVAKELGMVLEPKIPSLAIRFAHVACATIDAGVASPNAHDWDIAAADLILHESGALLADLDGRAPTYNRQETRHGTLVAAPLALHAELTQALARLRPVEEATGPHAKAKQT